MKKFLNFKNVTLAISLFIWQFAILPVKSFAEAITYEPLEKNAFDGFGITDPTANLGNFLSAAFNFLLAVAAALSVIMIVWGGVEIMLSESVFKKEDGKEKIKNAIYGLLLALFSWLILYIINPDILNFKLN